MIESPNCKILNYLIPDRRRATCWMLSGVMGLIQEHHGNLPTFVGFSYFRWGRATIQVVP